jgi:YHS domain-containing protein
MKRPPVSRFFDPICGMWLEAGQVAATFSFIGWTYAFCSEECRDLFAQKPDVYVIQLAQDPEAHIAHCCPTQRGVIGNPAGKPCE